MQIFVFTFLTLISCSNKSWQDLVLEGVASPHYKIQEYKLTLDLASKTITNHEINVTSKLKINGTLNTELELTVLDSLNFNLPNHLRLTKRSNDHYILMMYYASEDSMWYKADLSPRK
jgi:hypothetical protein